MTIGRNLWSGADAPSLLAGVRQRAALWSPAMQMRGWLLRTFRMAFIAIAAWVAYRVLEPKGLGWLVPLAGAVGAFSWIGFRYARIRRRRADEAQADLWAEALMDPPMRPNAVRELRARIGELDGSPRRLPLRARLTLVLAELLDADGEPAEALRALDALDVSALPPRTAVMVRHARAVASLSAGDAEAAEAILAELGGPSGDRSVDLRVQALRGVLAAERGDGERALEIAEELRMEAANDPELRIEARVLKAVGLDALGDRDDAVTVMRGLGEEMLGVLLVLGLPRVKELADLALDDDEP